MRIRWSLIVILLGIFGILGGQTATHAQDREQTRPYERFTAGGRGDNLVYYTPSLPDYPRLVRIINESITVFDTMTPTSWSSQIVIMFMGASISNLSVIGRMTDPSTAYVIRLEPQTLFPNGDVCFLRVFDGWEIDDNIESDVAKQLFHCLQMAIGAVAFQDFGVVSNVWWVGASAEWAASRVYPTQFPKPYQALFDFKRDVTQNRLENFYFWEFLASAQGYSSTQNVIEQLGFIRGSGLFPVNYGFDPTDLFHNWANVLLNRQLPIPPTLDLGDIDLVAGKSGSLVISLLRFSVDYKFLTAFEIEPGNIAFIKISDSATSNYAVSLRTVGGLRRFIDGEPIQLCPAEAGEMLIISRGRGEMNSPAPFTIEWGQMESETPCKPREDELTDGNMECVVGRWQVTAFPELDIFDTLDLSAFIFTFNANNTWTASYNITAVEEGNTLTVNLPLSGTYSISQSVTVDDDTTYTVPSFSGRADPGGTVSFITRNGDFTDMTNQYYTSGNYSLFGPATTMLCNNTTLSWVTAVGAGRLILTRLP